MSTLMSFIHHSLQPRLNDPANTRLWLPGLLAEMTNEQGGSVLPIRSDAQDLGFMQGEHGGYVAERFVQTWSIMNQKDAVADPLQPNPALKLSDVTLEGLQNLLLQQVNSQPTLPGYDASVVLLPNHYPDPTQGLEMPPLCLKGRYQIDQSLWVEDSYRTVITGTGTFNATFSNCVINAPLALETTGSAEQRKPVVALASLTISAISGEHTTLVFDDLTLEGGLEQSAQLIMFIKQALNAPDGQLSMLATVAEMLNSPDNLTSISSSLSEHLVISLDELLSVVPEDGLPTDSDNQQGATQLDVYFFDRLRVALNQADSDWYLPLLLSNSKDPQLEPYTHPHLLIPDQIIAGLTYTDIELNDLNVVGFSNAFAPLASGILTSPDIAMVIAFGLLPEGSTLTEQVLRLAMPPAPPVKLYTHLSLIQQGIAPVPLKGNVYASLLDCSLPLVLTVSGHDISDLELTINELGFLWGAEPVDFQVELEPRNSLLESMIVKMLVKPVVQNAIKEQLASAMADQRAEMSANFTRMARANLINKLS